MQKNSVLIYGANGYTGELIARYAADYYIKPILSGRNETAIRSLAEKLSLPFRVVSLDDPITLKNALGDIKVVIHAAGPFQFTALQMTNACLETGTHYIDINGDLSVFELLKSYDNRARQSGIMLLPGAGFDVVPTDCLALALKSKLPDATSLKIAFATLGGSVSHGTATSMIYKLGEGGAERKNGVITKVPLGEKGMLIDFGTKRLFVISIPWGDVSTAYHTTGIPNVETYTAMPKSVHRVLKLQSLFNPLLRSRWFRRMMLKRIDKRPAGASDEQRMKAISLVWAEVMNDQGQRSTGTLKGPEGYTMTMHGCLIIAKKILNNELKPGYQTPASAYGSQLVTEIPGVEMKA